jgi:FixJ family two-component response regulator
MLHITPSERRALQLLAQGHSPTDVAAGLGISSRETEAMHARLFGQVAAGITNRSLAKIRGRWKTQRQ